MTDGSAPPVSWTELARRTLRDTIDDDCLGLAAQLAYYFVFALFPALLFLLALSSFFSLDLLTDDAAQMFGAVVSSEVLVLIQDQMRRLSDSNDGGLLTIGMLGAVWGSSSALASIVSATNRAYDLEETRPWWKVRLIAILLTFGIALLAVLALAIVLSGPRVAAVLGIPVEWRAWEWTWLVLRWPLAFAFVAFAIGLVYHYAPNADQDWAWVTPGAVLATTLWLGSSLLFKIYIDLFTDYEASYGAVGGILVLLLWMYISGLGVLIGAELNGELEHAAAGETVPSLSPEGRRMIGRRARRGRS